MTMEDRNPDKKQCSVSEPGINGSACFWSFRIR